MASPTVGLSTHIWNNNLKCVMLLAVYPVLILGVFWMIVFALAGLGTSGGGHQSINVNAALQMAGNTTYQVFPLILTGVAIWFTLAWFFHTRMVRRLAHSHPVTRQEEPDLYNVLENLCISRGMPMPHLEVIETHARNAFASGINQQSYAITVTRGLMNSLAKDELEAVLAHELTHIQNQDVRLLIVTIIFTGLFGFLAQLVWSNIRYGIFYSSGQRGRNKGGAVLVFFIILIVLWLGYLASLMMRFALSRRREYMADAGAVEMTKNPDAMMRALMRIAGRDRIPESTDDIAMMCIENRKPFLGMFATHPPIEKRIKAISAVTNTPIPEGTSLPPIDKQERFSAEGSRAQRKNPWLIRDRR